MKRPNKFRNVRTTVGALNFDSKREAKRWQELQLLERAGRIGSLERQVTYELAHAVTLHGETRKKPALRYVADFRYFSVQAGHLIVEDAKGRDTPVGRIKRHLMKSVHGIDVRLS